MHNDTQKGVGLKLNLTRGLVRSTDKYVVRNNTGVIPGYSYYKWLFEVCDRFNRNLHDRSWPHTRGGNGTQGDYLNAHCFYMCIFSTAGV